MNSSCSGPYSIRETILSNDVTFGSEDQVLFVIKLIIFTNGILHFWESNSISIAVFFDNDQNFYQKIRWIVKFQITFVAIQFCNFSENLKSATRVYKMLIYLIGK